MGELSVNMVAVPEILNWDAKKTKIGLLVSASLLLIVMLICLATYGWLSYTVLGIDCKTSLSEVDCDGFSSQDLKDGPKDEGETMAGLGAMAFIFLFINLIVLIFLLIAGLASLGLSWLFLTAGWCRFVDSEGGCTGTYDYNCDYGASFAFIVLSWLCYFPFIFVWLLLANKLNSEEAPPADKVPDGPAQQAPPVYTNDSREQTDEADAPAPAPATEEAPAPAEAEQH